MHREFFTKIDAVAAAARELRRVRAEALPKLKGGLRALYRTLEWTRSRPLARPAQGLLLRKMELPFLPIVCQHSNAAVAACKPFAVSQTVQVPGAKPLKDAHAALDTAVLTAYGFSAKKDLLALWSRFGRLPQRLATSYSTGRAQLLALNQEVAAKIEKGEPVIAPGVPKNYPGAKKLVTEDCIRPKFSGAVQQGA